MFRDLTALLGERNVFGVDLRPSRVPESQSKNVRVADVARAEIVELLDEIKPSTIVHAAAHPGGKSISDPTANLEVNVLGSIRIFEWCARNRCKILYLSSSIIYGEVVPIPIRETTTPHPETVYGIAKTACEQWLRVLGKGFDLDWVVLRPFSTYGAGHNPSLDQGIVNVMVTQIDSGKKITVKGSLDRLRDLVHVSDASVAICRTIELWPSRQILNVCTGLATSIREIIEIIAEVRGIESTAIQCQVVDGTIGDPSYNVGDASLAVDTIGFRSRILPRDGIAQTLSRRLNSRV